MTKTILEEWLAESQDNEKGFLQEELIINIAEQIWEVMEDKGVKKVDLAKALEKSKAYITRLLDGSSNMTFRTFSDICFALQVSPELKLMDKEKSGTVTYTANLSSNDLVIGNITGIKALSSESSSVVSNSNYSFGGC